MNNGYDLRCPNCLTRSHYGVIVERCAICHKPLPGELFLVSALRQMNERLRPIVHSTLSNMGATGIDYQNWSDKKISKKPFLTAADLILLREMKISL